MRLKKEQRLKLNKFPNLYSAIESFIHKKAEKLLTKIDEVLK